jgi:hypothetical protein
LIQGERNKAWDVLANFLLTCDIVFLRKDKNNISIVSGSSTLSQDIAFIAHSIVTVENSEQEREDNYVRPRPPTEMPAVSTSINESNQ